MIIPIAVSGALGRMGRAVVRLAREAPDLEVVAAWEHAGHPGMGTTHPDEPRVEIAAPGSGDRRPGVVVDFSTPAGASRALEIARSGGMAFVSGTTGLDAAFHAEAAAAARDIPVLVAPNMSAGVYVLRQLTETLLTLIGDDPDFDLELTEIHHGRKNDAPSGTALHLLDAIRSHRGARVVHGREGAPGPRQSDEVGCHALRGGDVVGEHTLYVFGQGERLEISHRATSRDVFARGALRAARWCFERPPGSYDMDSLFKAAKDQ
ncbi:MAG: 4-hydroxy-tetrahydrodipicolinate reductase [Pseudomonadota bacterium]